MTSGISGEHFQMMKNGIAKLERKLARSQKALKKAKEVLDEIVYEIAGSGTPCCQECAVSRGEPHDEACNLGEDLAKIDAVLTDNGKHG